MYQKDLYSFVKSNQNLPKTEADLGNKNVLFIVWLDAIEKDITLKRKKEDLL